MWGTLRRGVLEKEMLLPVVGSPTIAGGVGPADADTLGGVAAVQQLLLCGLRLACLEARGVWVARAVILYVGVIE
jgi:hypothetical protein